MSRMRLCRVSVIVRVGPWLEILNEWILSSQRIDRGHAIIGVLNLRHLRETVDDPFEGSIRLHHNRYAGIIDNDDLALREDDKDAVLEVFVGDRLVIQ